MRQTNDTTTRGDKLPPGSSSSTEEPVVLERHDSAIELVFERARNHHQQQQQQEQEQQEQCLHMRSNRCSILEEKNNEGIRKKEEDTRGIKEPAAAVSHYMEIGIMAEDEATTPATGAPPPALTSVESSIQKVLAAAAAATTTTTTQKQPQRWRPQSLKGWYIHDHQAADHHNYDESSGLTNGRPYDDPPPPPLPGAYAHFTNQTTSQQMTPVEYSLFGANSVQGGDTANFSFGSSSSSNSSHSSGGYEDLEQYTSTIETQNSGDDDDELLYDDLAVANLVDMDGSQQIRGVAVPMMPQAPQERKLLVPKWNLCAGILLFLIVIGTSVVLGVILLPQGNNKDQPKQSIVPNATNASSTTRPDFILSMKQHVISLLPEYTASAALIDPDSPQSRAYQWILEDPSLTEYPDWRIQQRMALATVHYATGDKQQWLNQTNWLSYDHHECTWYSSCIRFAFVLEVMGVESLLLQVYWDADICNSHGQYKQLRLYSNNLQGTLPPELSMLSELQTILMFANFLQGTIPPQAVSNLPHLELLGLLGNQLTGTLPTQLGTLTAMRGLGLFNNELVGPIPSELGLMTKLEELQLGENKFSGAIPTQFGSLKMANKLLINNAGLTGTIPSQLGLMSSLRDWNLAFNKLSGSLPTQLGELSSTLSIMHLKNNLLSGKIPTELGLLDEMTYLDLSGNDLQGRFLPQEVVTSLVNSSLSYINLAGNPHLSGTIPSSVCAGEPGAIQVLFSCSVSLCGCECSCCCGP